MSLEKPNIFYRFRPIARLLGQPSVPEKLAEDGTCLEPAKPAVLGELEEGYIFFPSPESLNDPYEGYTKFHWAGDQIVWTNLFKHYVHSLGIHHVDRMVEAKQRPIPAAPSRAPQRLWAVFEEAAELIVADERIQAHIRELAHSERQVSKAELQIQFMAVHPFISDRLFFVFAQRGLVADYTARGDEARSLSDVLLAAQAHANLNNLPSEGIETHFFRLGVVTRAANFTLAVAQKRVGGEDEIIVDFPTLYTEQLASLTHSPWYVACFMSDCTNSAIWGSYGNNHSGACLIFDTIPNDDEDRCLMLSVPQERSDGWKTRDWRAKLQKVEYTDVSLELNFFECLFHLTRSELDSNWLTDGKGGVSTASRGYGTTATNDKYWDGLEKRLTRKWDDWAQENEYRIVYNPSLMDASKPEHRKLKYQFSSLKGICFGAKTRFEDMVALVDKITELCEKNDRSDFLFQQAVHNPITNKLQIVPLVTLTEVIDGKLRKGSIPLPR